MYQGQISYCVKLAEIAERWSLQREMIIDIELRSYENAAPTLSECLSKCGGHRRTVLDPENERTLDNEKKNSQAIQLCELFFPIFFLSV